MYYFHLGKYMKLWLMITYLKIYMCSIGKN